MASLKVSSDTFIKSKYLSQHFVTNICDDLNSSNLQNEINKVVFDIKSLKIQGANAIANKVLAVLAAYVKDIDKAIFMSNHFSEKGYETAINIMAISRDQGTELDEALHQIEEEGKVNVINIVDSFGALYQENIEHLVKKFKSIIKKSDILKEADFN